MRPAGDRFFWESDRPSVGANKLASYDGGKIDRLNKNWLPQHRSGDAAILDSWQVMTPRMRDLVRNSPTVISAQRELVKHVIGTGIITLADVTTGVSDGIPVYDEEFNAESDDWFEHWANEEFDVEGKKAFADAQWQMFSETVGVGASLLLECMDNSPGRSVPLCYQVLEPEQLDQSMDRPAGANGENRIVRGIELDKRNRAVAYWIYDAHPYDQYSGWTTKSTRIPASRVIHQFAQFRPSQTGGVSWLSAIMQPSRDVDWYLGNELTAAAIGSLLTMIVKRANANAGLGWTDGGEEADEFGNELLKFGRGNVAVIGEKDEVKVAQSGRPNRDANAFIKLMMEQAGMAAGVSYIRLTSDLKATSYTAARAAHLHDAAFFRPIQQWVARESVIPVRRRHTAIAVARGLISSVSARQFEKQRHRWNRLLVQGPGREQLDPEKETDSAVGRMRSGLSSLPEENALLGRVWKKTLQQQGRALAYAQKIANQIGIPLTQFLDFSKGASKPAEAEEQVADDGSGGESDDRGNRDRDSEGVFAGGIFA